MNLLRLFQQPDPDKPLGGRYKVISQLAAGGFGQTFLAHDMHLPGQPRCVVKQLKPQVSDTESLQTARRLFDTEAQALYHLGNHDQIPRLLAHFEDNQEFYLAQELIEGEPLTAEFASGEPWPESKVIALLQDMLQVLAFVHQQQVIHRDIKPSNLMRRRQDGRIVLIDFGAVKQVSTQIGNPKTGKTNLTVSIGTQGYMPKEQLGGNPRFSSDVYAVGVIGIQALTGTHPRLLPEDAQTGEIMWHDRASQASPEVLAILDKMVRYDFRARYVSAADALEALQSLPTELLESVPPPQPLQNAPEAASTQELFAPTVTGETAPIEGAVSNNAPPAPKSQDLPPPTATGKTAPIMGAAPNTPPAVPKFDSGAKSSIPTVAVGNGQSSQPSPASPTVTLQQVIQKYGVKPWQIIAAVVALSATVLGIKAILSPQPGSQTASSNSVSSATADSGNQAAQLLSQADRLREAENYQESITAYEKAIALKSNEAKAHWGLCYSLNQIGKPQDAIAQCDQALALNPNYPEALYSKGNSLHQQQNYEQELKLYDQALKLNPNLAEVWHNQGVALIKLKRYDQAFAALDKASQLNPNSADSWANRGNALFGLKRYDEGFASLEKALQIDPNHTNANNLLQQARRNLGIYGDEQQKSKDKSKPSSVSEVESKEQAKGQKSKGKN